MTDLRLLLLLACTALSTVASAVDWHVSFSRGNDTTGDGSIGAPYKEFAKVTGGSGVASDGDRMLLACDDRWDRKFVGGWKDNLDNITITSYAPTGVVCGDRKPTITFFIDTDASDWTWDATDESWYYANASGTFSGMLALFGQDKDYGNRIEHFMAESLTPWNEIDMEYDWDRVAGQLHVWTPGSGDNPVDYYGAVRVLSGPVFPLTPTAAVTEGNGLVIDGIHLEDIGNLVKLRVLDTTGGPHTGIRLTNSSSYRTGAILYIAGEYNTSNKVSNIEIDNNEISENLAGGVATVRGHVTNVSVHHNTFDGCALSWLQGSCFYITGWETDVIADQAVRVYENVAGRCSWGLQSDHSGDGGCFYAESGHNGVKMYSNFIYDSESAFWANGGVSEFYSNVSINTGIFIGGGDSNGLNRVNVKVWNNSAHCVLFDGMFTDSPVPPTWDVVHGCINFRVSALDNAAEAVAIQNNVIHVSDDGTANGGKGISIGTGEVGTITESNNNIYGHRSGVPYGNPQNNTPRALHASSKTTDPQTYGGTFYNDPADMRLKSGSGAIRAGKCLLPAGSCVYNDYRGYRARVPPDIGAYQRNQ